MKRLDLEPTDENIISCLSSDLAIRHEDIRRFISLLDAIEPPFSICMPHGVMVRLYLLNRFK